MTNYAYHFSSKTILIEDEIILKIKIVEIYFYVSINKYQYKKNPD